MENPRAHQVAAAAPRKAGVEKGIRSEREQKQGSWFSFWIWASSVGRSKREGIQTPAVHAEQMQSGAVELDSGGHQAGSSARGQVTGHTYLVGVGHRLHGAGSLRIPQEADHTSPVERKDGVGVLKGQVQGRVENGDLGPSRAQSNTEAAVCHGQRSLCTIHAHSSTLSRRGWLLRTQTPTTLL